MFLNQRKCYSFTAGMMLCSYGNGCAISTVIIIEDLQVDLTELRKPSGSRRQRRRNYL